MYYLQKNLTITKEQAEYIRNNYSKMSISRLAKELGLTKNKTHHNMRVMGLVKGRKSQAIKMNGYFDIDEFYKKYKY
jgi:hypothetical protein